VAEYRVRSDELRRNLRALMASVEHEGAHVEVLRYDMPVAVLVPVEWYEQAKARVERGGGR